MKLFTTKEICNRIPGITTRTLIDLVEKKLVTPAKDSGGQGEHRVYNTENIFSIMFCVAIRGMLTTEMVRKVNIILRLESTSRKIPFDKIQYVVITNRNRRKNGQILTTIIPRGESISNEIIKAAQKEATMDPTGKSQLYMADTFTHVVVDVGGMIDFINKTFI